MLLTEVVGVLPLLWCKAHPPDCIRQAEHKTKVQPLPWDGGLPQSQNSTKKTKMVHRVKNIGSVES